MRVAMRYACCSVVAFLFKKKSDTGKTRKWECRECDLPQREEGREQEGEGKAAMEASARTCLRRQTRERGERRKGSGWRDARLRRGAELSFCRVHHARFETVKSKKK